MDQYSPSFDLISKERSHETQPRFRVGNARGFHEIEELVHVRPPRDLASVTFAYNKRNGGQIMTTLRRIMADAAQEQTSVMASSNSPLFYHNTCIIRKLRNWSEEFSCRHKKWTWHLTAKNVLAVSSTLFPPGTGAVWARTAPNGKKRVSTLIGLVERALKPTVDNAADDEGKPQAKQPMRGSSRVCREKKVFKGGKSKGKSVAAHCVRAMQRGTIHEIGVVCDFPYPTWFRKESLSQRRRTAGERGTKKRENYQALIAREEEYFGVGCSGNVVGDCWEEDGNDDWEDCDFSDNYTDCDLDGSGDELEGGKATEWTLEELIEVSLVNQKKQRKKM